MLPCKIHPFPQTLTKLDEAKVKNGINTAKKHISALVQTLEELRTQSSQLRASLQEMCTPLLKIVELLGSSVPSDIKQPLAALSFKENEYLHVPDGFFVLLFGPCLYRAYINCVFFFFFSQQPMETRQFANFLRHADQELPQADPDGAQSDRLGEFDV